MTSGLALSAKPECGLVFLSAAPDRPDLNGVTPMTDDTTARPTNRLAPVALILAILVPIAGAILGHLTLRQIAQTAEPGRGIALAATVIGWVGTVAWFVFWGIFLSTVGSLSA